MIALFTFLETKFCIFIFQGRICQRIIHLGAKVTIYPNFKLDNVIFSFLFLDFSLSIYRYPSFFLSSIVTYNGAPLYSDTMPRFSQTQLVLVPLFCQSATFEQLLHIHKLSE